MFIVCPSCSGPYRIAADQIAPLVQTACPHCEYRVILDFEAANEPALREAGHQFAQGFESVEAYASVYDHVTSKPDAQPREGVTAVAAFAGAATSAAGAATSAAGAATTAKATGTSGVQAGGAPVLNRPLQQQPRAAEPVATASQSGAGASVRSAGSKTVLQVPSKKPVSMDPVSGGGGDSPSLSGSSSMRAGKGVDLIEAPGEAKPEERKPPHTPPTASVVSSGPPPSESPTPPPEDIAAQSGSHPAKVVPPPAETRPAETKPAETKPAVKPDEPKSSMMIFIIIAVLIIGVVVVLIMMNR